MKPDVFIVGVTGATGAGKGLVCEIFAEGGAYIVDTDKIAHAVILRGGAAYDEVLECFRDGSPLFLTDDGEIDRKRLGEIVFSDDEKLKNLTEITHKHITAQVFADIAENAARYRFAVIDAPLLIESGAYKYCDYIVGVVAEERLRAERIRLRDGLNAEQAAKRVNRQTPFGLIREYADIIIYNDGDLDGLRGKAEAVLKGILDVPNVRPAKV
jgi:dephospho-CoA kinase